MKHFYILTGYDVKTGKLSTRKLPDAQHAYDVISCYQQMPERYKTVKDFEFDVQSCSSHGHGCVVDNDPSYAWSAYCV